MTPSPPLGEAGRNLNFSVAQRAMNTPPDPERVAQYDTYPAKGNALQYIALVLALVCMGGAFYLYKGGGWITGTLALIAGAFLALLSRSFGKATTIKAIAYENGLLIPGVITSLAPLEITALANVGTTEDQPSVYGAIRMAVAELPGHRLALGERVPCVALFGMGQKGYRRHFEPRPVCWGYEPAIVEQATTAIAAPDEDSDDDARNDWDLLAVVAPQLDPDAPAGEAQFFDAGLRPITLDGLITGGTIR